MKKGISITCVLLIAWLFSGCKKDIDSNEGGGSNTGAINFTLTAPSCLVTKLTMLPDDETVFVEYDNQKRVIKVYQEAPGIGVTNYTYIGNTINEYSKDQEGNISNSIHTMNSSGLIVHSLTDRRATGGDRDERNYTYNNDGYLIREITKSISSSNDTFYYGRSYAYDNGNKTKSFRLIFDSNRQVYDSAQESVYEYYTDKPSRYGAFSAWVERTGRPDKHELKSESSTFFNISYEYTYGQDGFPIKVKQTMLGSSREFLLTWRCN